MPDTFERAFAEVQDLVSTFHANQTHYLSPQYQEQEARQDFIDKFWTALGWDVHHHMQRNPYEQEVKVERGVTMSEGRRRADYSFSLAPDFQTVRFFVEAKKPSEELRKPDHYFQTIRYGWNGQTPLAVLTDFEQFHILDCRGRPDIETALDAAVRQYRYHDYADRDKFAEIYWLFSREAVADKSLEKFVAAQMKRAPGRGGQRRLDLDGIIGIDEAFLRDLDGYRGLLARAFHATNPTLDSETLTEATQRVLDRLVFLRFLEDKLIEPTPLVSGFVHAASAWAAFRAVRPRLDRVYNGNIFKEHLIDRAAFRAPDAAVFADICEQLASDRSPYLFNVIPIHILGSIYERFLGNVIVFDGADAKVDQKPEVRKAGGVYYTPDYIVRYIVENTVGKQIAGKTPEEIAKLRFADIACGSGSFLLGVYDALLRSHTDYYNAKARGRAAEARRVGCVEDEGAFRLSLWQKRDILLANIWGVDIDAQAVEVAQLSLYLKLLEDETTASAHDQNLLHGAILPTLNKNIVFGNSLIGGDILQGQLFDRAEERKLNAMDFKQAFAPIMRKGGFDAIVGNPPYIRIQTMQENLPASLDYYKKNYAAAAKGNYDIYVLFIERALQVLNSQGRLGYILPHKFFNAHYGEEVRGLVANGKHLSEIVHFGDQQVFTGATTYTALLFLQKAAAEQFRFVKVNDLELWRETKTASEGAINTSSVTKADWNFSVDGGSALFKKLSKRPAKLEHVASRMAQGIRTSANEVYVLNLVSIGTETVIAYSKQLGREVTLERNALTPFLQGREIKRYRLLPSGKVVLIPYRVKRGRTKQITEKAIKTKFPLTYAYLLENKDYLAARERGKMNGPNWYGFVYPKNVDIMRSGKILVPDIADRSAYALDKGGQYAFTSGYGITLRSHVQEHQHYILGLLNSKISDFYLRRVTTPMRGGFFRYFTQFMEQIPIRRIDFSDLADKARHDRMVGLVEQMLTARQEQAKALLPDRDLEYWARRCEALDRQIDELVYELYGLTEDEIAIVEGAA